MNVNGTATDSTTIESSSVISPSISGDASIIYIVYRISSQNYITAKYSTDGGSNWNYISSNPPNSNARWIESVMSNGKLHVTYQVSNTSLFRYFYNNSWSSEYTVSSGESGIYPRITAWYDVNDDMVYFMYKKYNTNDLKWREFNVATSSWSGNPQLAVSQGGSSPVGLAVTDSRITVYYNYFSDPYWYFQWIIKNKSNNSTISTCLEYPDLSLQGFLYSTVTNDYNTHVPLWYNYYLQEEYKPAIYQSNGYDCSLDLIYYNVNQEQSNVNFLNCSSSSNDVYVIWNDSYIGQNLRLIYDDQTPLIPQNLGVEIYTEGRETYPKLTWTPTNEPDVTIKTNAYQVSRRYSLNGGPWSAWYIIGYSNGNETEYIDYTISGLYAEANTAEYKIKVRDYTNHFSDFSSTVSINFSKFIKISSNGFLSYDYRLGQNYPNPFNPTTQIDFTIKSEGLVTLKVYDMIGTKVASLVNERKEPGNYTVTFNAANLPSGIYFYKLTSNNFRDTKKLILLK